MISDNDGWGRDPLFWIDGCMDGASCPDAATCREDGPESCPLLDDQFELPVELPLDKAMNDSY